MTMGLDEDDDSSSDSSCDEAESAMELQSSSSCRTVCREREEKFSALKRKRAELAERSTGKRIKAIQHQTLKLVSAEIQDGADRELLEEPGTRLPLLPHQEMNHREDKSCSAHSSRTKEQQKSQELARHMNRTEHLAGLSVLELGGGGDGQTKLEKDMEQCLESGDLQKAAELSDKIADRQLAIRIASAVSHRDAEQEKAQRDEQRKTKKKNRLRWGFDSKQRWERKGNM